MTVVVHLSYLGKYYSFLVDFSIVYIHFLAILAKPSYKISSDDLRPFPDPNNKIRDALEFEPGCTLKLMSQLSPHVIAETFSSVHFGYFRIKLSWKTGVICSNHKWPLNIHGQTNTSKKRIPKSFTVICLAPQPHFSGPPCLPM